MKSYEYEGVVRCSSGLPSWEHCDACGRRLRTLLIQSTHPSLLARPPPPLTPGAGVPAWLPPPRLLGEAGRRAGSGGQVEAAANLHGRLSDGRLYRRQRHHLHREVTHPCAGLSSRLDLSRLSVLVRCLCAGCSTAPRRGPHRRSAGHASQSTRLLVAITSMWATLLPTPLLVPRRGKDGP